RLSSEITHMPTCAVAEVHVRYEVVVRHWQGQARKSGARLSKEIIGQSIAAVTKAPGRNGVVVSSSKECCRRLSEHSLPGEDRLQRHCVICRENRVQVALVQDGHHRAVVVPEQTGQRFTNLRLDQLFMM